MFKSRKGSEAQKLSQVESNWFHYHNAMEFQQQMNTGNRTRSQHSWIHNVGAIGCCNDKDLSKLQQTRGSENTAMEMHLTPHEENIKSTMMEGSSCLKPPNRPANGIARHPFPSTSGSRPSKLRFFWYQSPLTPEFTRFSKFKTRSEEPLPSDDLQQNKGSYHGPTPELSLKLYLWEAPPPILNSCTHPVLFGTRASSSSKNITP